VREDRLIEPDDDNTFVTREGNHNKRGSGQFNRRERAFLLNDARAGNNQLGGTSAPIRSALRRERSKVDDR